MENKDRFINLDPHYKEDLIGFQPYRFKKEIYIFY